MNESYIYVEEADGTTHTEVIPATADGWEEVTLTADVSPGDVTIGIYSDAHGDA